MATSGDYGVDFSQAECSINTTKAASSSLQKSIVQALIKQSAQLQ